MKFGRLPVKREKGLLRLEARDYVGKDRDVMFFQFLRSENGFELKDPSRAISF